MALARAEKQLGAPEHLQAQGKDRVMRNTDDAQTIGPFPTETEGLPEAARPEVVELSDGDEFSLEISLVTGVQQPSVAGCSSPQGHPKARFTPVIE